MSYFIGAYASSPCGDQWKPELEATFYTEIKKMPNVQGLEHPFLGSLHPHDDQWFLDNIDPNWNYVFTCIPGTMSELSKNPDFGLASSNEAGRHAALTFLDNARIAIKKLNSFVGRNAVSAIQIHSAPNQNYASSSKEHFQASLEVLLNWDWYGTKVVIEHCDTLTTEHAPAKGFLTIEEEIEAIKKANTVSKNTAGIIINWGRSVIETHHVNGAIEHITQAKDSGLLSGIMFSGVSDQETEFGAWQDTHMPPSPLTESSTGEPTSLMTAQEMHRCLNIAQIEQKTDLLLGVKLGIRPSSATIEDRIAYNTNALAILGKVL
ncbi:DUF4862 family protein [Marinomonas sp. 2405UD68-3]|uniref:DUF4862 family protein n=1 Tax=Marinomonas sp. 2405UD68-3 TaxID=3391835 RepID=UPI0039C957A0